MNELDDRRCMYVVIAGVSQGTGGQQYDQWAQSLAAARHDVFGYLRHECDVALQALTNQEVDCLHVDGRQVFYFVNCQGLGCFFGGLHGVADNA